MGFIDAIKSGFRNHVNFKGRARRSEYWFFVLFNILAGFVAGFLDWLMWRAEFMGGPFYLFVALGLFLPGLALVFRRLHDTGRSAWWLPICGVLVPLAGYLVGLVVSIIGGIGLWAGSGVTLVLGVIASLIGWIILLVFYIEDSQPGPNKYGPNPKDMGTAAAE